MHGNDNGFKKRKKKLKKYKNIGKSVCFASDCGHIQRNTGRDKNSELKTYKQTP